MTACPWFVICDWSAILSLSALAFILIGFMLDREFMLRLSIISCILLVLMGVNFWLISTIYQDMNTPAASTCYTSDPHVQSRAAMNAINANANEWVGLSAWGITLAVMYYVYTYTRDQAKPRVRL